jgi:expansin (peptidoglycan-binding protein)
MEKITMNQLHPRGWQVYAALLILLLGLAQAAPARGQAGGENPTWLPMVIGPAAANTNPLHSGIATYYNADGSGSCGFGATPGDLMVAAINEEEYFGGYCGAYVHVVGPKGEVTVRIVDMCPGCAAGHLDLSAEAFAQIADPVQGRVDITWQVVSPELSGPITYYFMKNSNEWWAAVQVRNHRNPVSTLEYLNKSGVWVLVPRDANSYFIMTNAGKGPFSFRVTDWYGNVLTDSGIPFVDGGASPGASQFPPWP